MEHRFLRKWLDHQEGEAPQLQRAVSPVLPDSLKRHLINGDSMTEQIALMQERIRRLRREMYKTEHQWARATEDGEARRCKETLEAQCAELASHIQQLRRRLDARALVQDLLSKLHEDEEDSTLSEVEELHAAIQKFKLQEGALTVRLQQARTELAEAKNGSVDRREELRQECENLLTSVMILRTMQKSYYSVLRVINGKEPPPQKP